jgi:hypothetical protein
LGDSLRSNQVVVEWSEGEAALTVGLYHLRHLHQSWTPVLSKDILIRSTWYLSDVLFTLFLNQVLAAQDISTSASQLVSTLIQRMTQEVLELVEKKTSGSRVWDRISAVGKLMDMSLGEIEVALSDGVFSSITGPELIRFICALFSDSLKRKAMLDLLASH